MINSQVKQLLGITEDEFVELTDRSLFIAPPPLNENPVLTYIKNSQTGEIFSTGQFWTPTIRELKTLVIATRQTSTSNKNSCKLEVATGVDIGELQGKILTSEKATVQVASNFNCLEVPSRTTAPDSGFLVESASRDGTQGPAASFGPLSAYLYRAHLVFPDYQGQTKLRQINLLDNVKDYLGVPENGKLTLRGDEKPITATNKEEVVDRIRAGLHLEVPVIFARKGRMNVFKLQRPYPTINQCFNASINLGDYGKHQPEESVKPITKALLQAAYESAYLCAILQRSKTLYLTLIGGGSFSNPLPLITEAIKISHAKWANHPTSNLERVVVCTYSAREGDNTKLLLGC